MGIITEARQELLGLLEGGPAKVMGPWPAKVEAPAIVVVPEAPYLTPGSISTTIHLQAVCTVLKSKGLTALDDLVEHVINNSDGWAIPNVDSPAVPSDRPDLLVAVVHLALEIEL